MFTVEPIAGAEGNWIVNKEETVAIVQLRCSNQKVDWVKIKYRSIAEWWPVTE